MNYCFSDRFSLYFQRNFQLKERIITIATNFFALSILILIEYGSASASLSFFVSDTTKTDSAAAMKSDSLIRHIYPIPLVGSVDKKLPNENIVTDSSINFLDYKLASDLLMMKDGVFVRELGSPGQFDALNINGLESREISFLADGIPLREPMAGIFDMNLYPLEHAERIEFITGSRAFLYDINSTGGVVNFVSKSKKAIKPYSRIRYTQTAYGFTLFDGMFSQDIYRGVNATAGLQHATTAGRYLNNNFDAWNARLKIRSNFSNTFNMYVSTMYNQTLLGLNGGVTDTIPYFQRFDPLLTYIINQTAYEKITRYDHQLGFAVKLTSDSTLVSSLTLYHSTSLREYRDPGVPYSSDSIPTMQDHLSQWYGAKFSHSLIWSHQQFDLTAEVERLGVIASPLTGQQLDARSALYGKSETFLFNHINFAGYGRLDRYLGQSRFSYGADASINPDTNIYFFSGFSHSYRFPTIEERFRDDNILAGMNFSAPTETHDLFEAGIRLRNSDLISGEVKVFHRTINDGIIIVPDTGSLPGNHYAINPNRTIRGVSGNASLRIGKFFAEGSGQYIKMSDSTAPFVPQITGTGGIYYWTELLDGHLHLKTGLRGRIVPSFMAPGYDPNAQVFLAGRATQTPLVGIMDVVFIAKLGDAYIHLIWDNFFSRSYYITSFYPMTDRAIRMGVSWEFTN
ncbi:MAG: putative porin [Bacteroidota bacterium]